MSPPSERRQPADGAPRTLASEELAEELRARLGSGRPTALWEQGGARVLVHAARVETEVHEQGLVARVPLEADEAAGEVTVVLALARGDDPPDLLAATDEQAPGDAALAARWGATLQEAVFAVLVELLEDHARSEDAEPLGLRVRGGALELVLAGAAAR